MERKYADDRVAYTNGKQNMINKILGKSQKSWNMTESPSYYRCGDAALFSGIENKEEYEFLRGNKELESIFKEYLK